MRVLAHDDPDFEEQLWAMVSGSSLFDPEIEERTRALVRAVGERGDEALVELTERFDGVHLEPEQFAVGLAEILGASAKADDALRAAVAEADGQVAAFAKRSRRKNWRAKNQHGAWVGEKFDPFERVGIYIPGGTAPLVSTAIMTVTLARVAGCPEIVVCTPPGRDGVVHPALLYAARAAGATEIYKVGGAQAVAAMALGTETIDPVQKVFGPGNAYVVAAKRILFGRVAVDLLPGPSEVLVLADDTAEPAWVAADLLAQAEHGSGHERVWLVTPSKKLGASVQREVKRQLPKRARREFIERVMAENAWVIRTTSMEQAVAVVNFLAPEHCEVHTRAASRVAEDINCAGAIFLGGWSPTVLGDYVAGPSHTLPTGGAGRSFAGLTVDQFQRRTSVVEYTGPSLRRAMKTVREFAAREGLEAHGASAEVRIGVGKGGGGKRKTS
jgi:histidinol dehydrogenase